MSTLDIMTDVCPRCHGDGGTPRRYRNDPTRYNPCDECNATGKVAVCRGCGFRFGTDRGQVTPLPTDPTRCYACRDEEEFA
jgi:hypothetical protein